MEEDYIYLSVIIFLLSPDIQTGMTAMLSDSLIQQQNLKLLP
jgi:hypothetical protein